MNPGPADLQQQELELVGLPGGWTAFFALLAVLLVMYVVVSLYRGERRAGASSTVRIGLAVVRCAVLALLLGIALEPVIATYRHNTRPGSVIVLYDVSASMGVQDPDLDPAAVPEPRRSRSARVHDLLSRDDYSWLRRLENRNRLSLYAFGDGVERIQAPWQAAASGSPQSARADGAPLPSPARLSSRTDLGEALQRTLQEMADGPIGGVVVLSDGATNRGARAEALAALARLHKAPVYPVGVGALAEPENVRVAQVVAPATTPLGDPFELTVDVAATGPSSVEVQVELRVAPAQAPESSGDAGGPAPIGDLLESRTVSLEPGAPPTVLKFQVHPGRAGEFRYLASIPATTPDANVVDNLRETPVRVLDEQYRVLLVAGRPSYEYRFVTNLLERDKSINVSVWLQSADAQAVRDGDTVLTELPRRPEELLSYDVVLLLDVFAGDLDSAWAATVRRFVDEFRGGLLLQAGPHFTSRLLRDERLGELVGMLPIEPDPEADVRLSEQGAYRTSSFGLEVPDDARTHPILACSPDPLRTSRTWQSLPGVWWSLPVEKAKPLASVLLRQPAPHRGAAGMPLLAVQPVGGGRVAFMGFDGTWRWRATAENHFNRFWVQIIRYLAHGRREDANARGAIVLDRDSVNLGDYVRIEARLLDSQFVPWFEPQVDAEVSWPDGSASPLKLAAIPDRPGWFTGRLLFEQAGPTTINLPLPGDAADAKVAKVIRVQQPDFEMRTLRQDADGLRELAARSGGEYFTLENAGDLPDRIADARQTTVARDPNLRSLWDRPWLLATVAGLLALEWTIRRRNYLL